MADWFMLPNPMGNGNGTSFANACSPTSIPWGNIGATDTLWFGEGIYTDHLTIQKSGIDQNNQFKIWKTTDPNYRGKAIFFGGRFNAMPGGRLSSGAWSSVGTAQDRSGINFGDSHSVWFDGGPGRTSIHGWGRNGITFNGTNQGKWRISRFDIFENGRVRQGQQGDRGNPGYWTDDEGIELTGSDVIIEDCTFFDNGQDCLQNRNNSKMVRMIVRRCVGGNTYDHPVHPHITWQMDQHSDFGQTFNGADDCRYEDLVIMNQFHGLITCEPSAPFTNSRVERVVFINCHATIRNKNSQSDGNYYGDIIAKKTRMYYSDDGGNGFAGGTNFELRGKNNTYGPMIAVGRGSWLSRESPNNNVGPFYTDGSMLDPMPNEQVVDLDFENPGPEGNFGVSLTDDWEYRSLRPRHPTVAAAFSNINYFGPMDWAKAADGIDYVTFPYPARAGGSNPPVFHALNATAVASGGNVNYQVDAYHPDGLTIAYSLFGLPGGSISNTGVITANGLADGEYRPTIRLSSGSKVAEARLTITVGAGGGGGAKPVLQQPGTQSDQVNKPARLELVATDPDSVGLTFSALGLDGLPPGLDIDPNTGVISGTPYALGSYDVRVTVSDGINSVSQEFRWIITADAASGATTLFTIPDQRYALGDVIDIQVALSDALRLGGTIRGVPDWAMLAIVQPQEIEVQDGDNAPPVIEQPDEQAATVGQLFSFAMQVTDADNDSIAWSMSPHPELSIHPSTGVISGTPAIAETITVQVTADDGNGGVDLVAFDIVVSAVANNDPVITDPVGLTGTVGQLFSHQMQVTDADNDSIAWSMDPHPTLLIDPNSGVISGTPTTAETATVTVTADDGNGGTDDSTFDIVISAVASPVTVNLVVDNGNDDAESGGAGEVWIDRITMTLNGGSSTKIAFRFKNVSIPQGKTITAADFQTYINAGGSRNDPGVNLHAENADDSPALTTTTGNIENRTLTTAFVNWTESDLPAGFASAPDIASVIQEVINRPGWVSGGSITVLMVDVDGHVRVRSYENNPSYGAKLSITYNP